MIHDPDLLDCLSTIEGESFSGTVFRATRISMDPLAPSTRGGRWAPSGQYSILYTSLTKDAALAEITYYWSQLDPVPSKKLPEGVYLATSDDVPGLVAQGRTITETLEIARDVAKKLLNAQAERRLQRIVLTIR